MTTLKQMTVRGYTIRVHKTSENKVEMSLCFVTDHYGQISFETVELTNDEARTLANYLISESYRGEAL